MSKWTSVIASFHWNVHRGYRPISSTTLVNDDCLQFLWQVGQLGCDGDAQPRTSERALLFISMIVFYVLWATASSTVDACCINSFLAILTIYCWWTFWLNPIDPLQHTDLVRQPDLLGPLSWSASSRVRLLPPQCLHEVRLLVLPVKLTLSLPEHTDHIANIVLIHHVWYRGGISAQYATDLWAFSNV